MSVTIALAMSITNVSHIIGAENRREEKGLYIYSNRELSNFFKYMGYQYLWYNDIRIGRNSDGTALRFLNESKRKIIVAACDGSVTIMDSPGYLAWLNDMNQVVAWFDDKSNVHYANGMSEKRPFSPVHGPDPSGKYFIKEPPDLSRLPLSESCYTSIFSIKKPNMPLVKVNICGATKIFYKDGKVFFTGSKYRDGNLEEKEMYIFKEKGNTLEQIEKIMVPKPDTSVLYFYAEDLSPWDDEALYLDAHDFPTRSIWYSFNLKTHKLNKVGKVPWFGGRAFYLQCDIIKKITKKFKEKK
jgi:hypothetical protein